MLQTYFRSQMDELPSKSSQPIYGREGVLLRETTRESRASQSLLSVEHVKDGTRPWLCFAFSKIFRC